jgi:hypothetical protein
MVDLNNVPSRVGLARKYFKFVMYDVQKYVHHIFLCLGHMNVLLSSPYYVGVAPKIASVSQLWTTSRGKHLGKFYMGNGIFPTLQHFFKLHHVPKSLYTPCVSHGNCLTLWASMCNFVPFTCYFSNMPLHPWSKFPTKFTKYTWSNLQTCLLNMVACPFANHS